MSVFGGAWSVCRPEPQAKDLLSYLWRRLKAGHSLRAGRHLFLLLLLAQALSAQQREIPVQAGTTINHDTVTVGDVVTLVVRVRAPLGATINFPAAVDSLGAVQALALFVWQ